jgi:hypothetical protein
MLPPFIDFPVPPPGTARRFSTIQPDLIVVHATDGGVQSGQGTANWCKINPNGYRWHWSVGSFGLVFKHLPSWRTRGAHASGINHRSVGIEFCGTVATRKVKGTPFIDFPQQLEAGAKLVADACRFMGKPPSRDFIIGHSEDARFGGDSTHTDPGATWPWDEFMELVEEHFAGREDDMTPEQAKRLESIEQMLQGLVEWKNDIGDKLVGFLYGGSQGIQGKKLETFTGPPAKWGEASAKDVKESGPRRPR